ncbi:MAG: hypothetical protein AB7U05_05615 [Mangrovibacterium sp.]
MFEEKLEEGKGHMPLKKLKPKKEKVEVIPVSPEMIDNATIVVELIDDNKKKNPVPKPLYNNKTQVWGISNEPAENENQELAADEISREIPIEDAEEVTDIITEEQLHTTEEDKTAPGITDEVDSEKTVELSSPAITTATKERPSKHHRKAHS